jgi:hypothetical protein
MGTFIKAARTWFAVHRKTVTALAGVALIAADDAVTGTAINWQTIIIGVAAALGVYAVPNQPKAP